MSSSASTLAARLLPKTKRAGVIYCFVSTLLASGFLLPFKDACQQAKTAPVVAVMFAVSALLNSLYAPFSPRPAQPESAPEEQPAPQGNPWAFTFGLASVFALLALGGNLTMAVASKTLHPGVVSVLLQFQVVWVAMLGAVVLGERPSLAYGFGALLAVLGIGVMSVGPAVLKTGHFSFDFNLKGTFGALAAAICFGSMQVVTRKYIRRVKPVALNATRLWLAAVLTLLVGRVGFSDIAALSPHVWYLICLAAFLGPFLARVALFFGLTQVEATTATLVILTGPVCTFGLATLWGIAPPEPIKLLGALIVVGGVGLPFGVQAWARRAAA